MVDMPVLRSGHVEQVLLGIHCHLPTQFIYLNEKLVAGVNIKLTGALKFSPSNGV